MTVLGFLLLAAAVALVFASARSARTAPSAPPSRSSWDERDTPREDAPGDVDRLEEMLGVLNNEEAWDRNVWGGDR